MLALLVEEVDDHTFYGVLQRIMTEMVPRLHQSSLHGVEVLAANFLLLRRKLHDGILEQREMSAHTVIALWRGELYELLSHIYHINFEVITLLQTLHQVPSAGYNHAVARLETEQTAVYHS